MVNETRTINYFQCPQCNKEWADADKGFCDTCFPEVELKIAIANIYQSLIILENQSPTLLKKYKDSRLLPIKKRLDNLLSNQ